MHVKDEGGGTVQSSSAGERGEGGGVGEGSGSVFEERGGGLGSSSLPSQSRILTPP